MFFEQIDATTVQSHRWRVWQLETVLHVQLENLMLRRRLSRIGLQYGIHWRDALAAAVDDLSSELEDERRTADVQRVCRSPEWVVRQAWRIEHPVEHSRRADLALERRSADSREVIRGAEPVQHANDGVPAEIRGVTHRRAPVAALDQGVFV